MTDEWFVPEFPWRGGDDMYGYVGRGGGVEFVVYSVPDALAIYPSTVSADDRVQATVSSRCVER